MFEWGDYAANALQIQNAKHFHELLGNYSRWGFHHPGPAFFYLFAAGELVFHDWLHVMPQAMNAYVLTILLVNTLFLFSSIWIVARHSTTALFVPAAVAFSLFQIAAINRTVSSALDGSETAVSSALGGSETALSSVWMPYVLLFCFLLYLVSCAAVGCGNFRYLPVAIFTGLVLLHAHVAQVLFVGTLGLMMLASLLWRRRRQGAISTLVKDARNELLICGVLVCIFATPPLLDVLLHRPNNIDAIRTYMHDQIGLPNSMHQAVRYELSFFTFLPNPEVVLLQSSPGLLARGGAHPYVLKYWGFVVFLLGALAGLRMRGRIHLSPFIRYLLLEIVVVSLLFLYWTMKMAGGLYNFNGYFFYSAQFLAIFCLLSLIVAFIPQSERRTPRLAIALSCAAPFVMFTSLHQFRINQFRVTTGGGEEVNRIASAAQGRASMIQIVFGHDDWPIAVGVASRFKRVDQPFCVSPNFIMYGPESSCTNLFGIERLILTRTPRTCLEPCQVLLREDHLTAELSPYPVLKVPFALSTDSSSGLFEGFYADGAEGSPMWTTAESTIRFLAAQDASAVQRLRITVVGEARPGRAAELRLNDDVVGSITYGQPHSVEFVVPGGLLKNNSENEFSFSVPGAGPAGQDVRHLGFWLERIEVAAAGPQ
jgi:hypothetical protein